MKKNEVTLVIPAVKDLEESGILASFLASDIRHSLFVQFVYLTNKRKIGEKIPSTVTSFDTHEILHITNDRYFGSCEENIYRVQDFMGLFKAHVLCVGEHDNIDWKNLAEAIDLFQTRKLEAMGLNILVKQLKADGSYAQQLSILTLDEKSTANDYAKLLLGGQVLSACVAYPALISVYGPVDWAAYIGNQLYSREAFGRILQYKFSENVYSFVYKQAVFFRSHAVNYGFYTAPVIHRVSEDFLKMKAGTHSMGWLEDHRTVQGGSPSFWVANLLHLYQLEDAPLFNAISHSLCLSQVPAENGEIAHVRYAMLLHIFSWAKQVIQHKLEGKSHYLPAASGSSALQDLRYVKLYFGTLLASMRSAPLYDSLSRDVVLHLSEAMQFLSEYLETLRASDDLLKLVFEKLSSAQAQLPPEQLMAFNKTAFHHLLEAPSNAL